MLFAFRTKAHYTLMYQAYGALELNTWVRVTSTTLNIANPWRHYPRIVQPFSTCAMNSASVGTACAKYFSVPDGGDWWLKDVGEIRKTPPYREFESSTLMGYPAPLGWGDEATHQQPAVACCPRISFVLTSALLMTSPH